MSELSYNLDMLKKPVWKFVNASGFAKENLLYIQESGRFCSGEKYYTKRKLLNSHQIILTLSGKGILEYCGKKYTLTAGNVMFIDCRLPQFYYTDRTAKKWETVWVHFNGEKAGIYYDRFTEKNGGHPVAMLSPDSNATEIIENIIGVSENYSKDAENEFIADSLLHSLLAECITKTENSPADTHDYIKQIANYIRHHYSEELRLDTLSEEFNISKYHLQRTFKNAMGVSPNKYLANVRINRAKRLLRGTNLSVNEISEQVGMETNYFIQLFKSCENATPLQYRNRWCGKDSM